MVMISSSFLGSRITYKRWSQTPSGPIWEEEEEEGVEEEPLLRGMAIVVVGRRGRHGGVNRHKSSKM